MKKMVSIIVPIYNVEKYIDECIISIINQTYKNLEIILIDDGSKDNSGKIIDNYSKLDERIKVFHRDNSGVSISRNFGLKISSGDYICFVDSDDVLDENYIKILLDMILQHNADISFCANEHFSTQYSSSTFNSMNDIEYNAFELIKDIMCFKQSTYCWGTMFKKNVINEITFPEGVSLGEDMCFVYKAYLNSNKIVYNNVKLYKYRQQNDSLIHNYKQKKVVDYLLMCKDFCDKTSEKYNDLKKYSYQFILNSMIWGYEISKCDKNYNSQLLYSIKEYSRDVKFYNIKFKKRLKLTLYKFLSKFIVSRRNFK